MSRAPGGAPARRPAAPRVGAARRARASCSRDYLELTKPKVQSLLLLTTIATMYVAGDPSPGLVALTCLGGYLSAGGAGAVNHWFDRDIDAQMERTAHAADPLRAHLAARGAAVRLRARAAVADRAVADRQPAGRRAVVLAASSATCSSTPSG